jgi:hypothetical protein
MTWSRSVKAEPSTGNTSLDGAPRRRRASPKSAKSLDGIKFRSQRGPVSAKVKGFSHEASSKFMQAQPESFDNTITWSRNLQLADKTSRDGPPDAPLKSTKSLHGNEFGSQLGHTKVPSRDMICNSSDKRATASITLASTKLKSSPSTASSKFTQAQPELFDNTITWSRSLQLKPTTKRTSRRRAFPKSITRRKRIQLPGR